MWSTTIILCGLIALTIRAYGQSKFGPAYQIQQTKSYILGAETTLFPPSLPSPQQDTLLIWAGSSSDTKERYQGVLASYESKRKMCKARVGQWCVYGRILKGIGPAIAITPRMAINGVNIRVSHNPTTGSTLQTLASDGRILASFETASGRPKTWRTAIECQDDCGGITVGAHSYKNTTIKLANPDPTFGMSITSNIGDSAPLATFDGGRTWTISSINVQISSFGYF